MNQRKSHLSISIIILLLILSNACGTGSGTENQSGKTLSDQTSLADSLEASLFEFIIEPWYPLIIDNTNGGYTSTFGRDWTRLEDFQMRALVQQSRHVWSTAFIYEHYPERKEFLEYAAHGFRFLRDAMWDKELGGFHAYCAEDGTPQVNNINEKRIYGQSFAVYGLSQYYRMSQDPEALELVKKAFLWMEDHAHDPVHGGYFEFLERDGTPYPVGVTDDTGVRDSRTRGI